MMPQGMSVVRIVALERNLCAKLTPDDHRMAGGFLHFCNDWDGLLIDKTDPEFDCCSCEFSDDYDPTTGKLTAKADGSRMVETPKSGSMRSTRAAVPEGNLPNTTMPKTGQDKT